ncbi:hypothetical protein [Streptomyces sp. NBC_00203]|uniref:hypothetical protein n=1 Tax=Streptomyces sp. NBC_00203 TaxID=2975680 RepID=UPI00324EC6B0
MPVFTEEQPVKARIDLEARKTHAALRPAGHLMAGRAQGWTCAGNIHFSGQAVTADHDEQGSSSCAWGPCTPRPAVAPMCAASPTSPRWPCRR